MRTLSIQLCNGRTSLTTGYCKILLNLGLNEGDIKIIRKHVSILVIEFLFGPWIPGSSCENEFPGIVTNDNGVELVKFDEPTRLGIINNLFLS